MSRSIARLILTLACICSIPCAADTDFACLNNCLGTGTAYGLCQARCSYDSQPTFQVQPMFQPVQMQQTDFACVNQCLSTGTLYGLCHARCTY